MSAIFDAGYVYELAGLVYYVFFLFMLRKGNAQRFSQRSRIFTIVAAIALVASVPFHYATNNAAVAIVILVCVAALASAYSDIRATRR